MPQREGNSCHLPGPGSERPCHPRQSRLLAAGGVAGGFSAHRGSVRQPALGGCILNHRPEGGRLHGPRTCRFFIFTATPPSSAQSHVQTCKQPELGFRRSVWGAGVGGVCTQPPFPVPTPTHVIRKARGPAGEAQAWEGLAGLPLEPRPGWGCRGCGPFPSGGTHCDRPTPPGGWPVQRPSESGPGETWGLAATPPTPSAWRHRAALAGLGEESVGTSSPALAP